MTTSTPQDIVSDTRVPSLPKACNSKRSGLRTIWAGCKSVAVGFVAALALTQGASADGIDKMYTPNGAYVGELEIIRDVKDHQGVEYAEFIFPALNMTLYLDPMAVYTSFPRDNYMLNEQIPFYGYWVDTSATRRYAAGNCRGGPRAAPDGSRYYVHGEVRWTNRSLTNNSFLIFTLDKSDCNGQFEPWLTSEDITKHNNGPVPPIHGQLDIIDQVISECQTAGDLNIQITGCSKLISHHEATLQDVTWALWNRAIIRCGGGFIVEDVIADFMTAVRLDPRDWQSYFRDVGVYKGAIDGRITAELASAVKTFAHNGCR